MTLRVVAFWHCNFSEKQRKGKRIQVVLCIFVGTVHGHTTARNRLYLPPCSSKNHFKHPKDMANRKTLKKHINFVCSELFAECVALRHYKLTSATQDLDNVMRRILLMHSDFIARISHTEPGNARYFYKRLKEDFRLQTDEIINAISQIC